MQLMHLMQVVIVLFGIGQLLLKLNLSSSQNIFLRPGFISLMDNLYQHVLTIPIGGSQPLNLLPSHLIPVDSLISLLSHLGLFCL
jgi:hypothetical protein